MVSSPSSTTTRARPRCASGGPGNRRVGQVRFLGQAPMTYAPGPIANEAAVRARSWRSWRGRRRSGPGRPCPRPREDWASTASTVTPPEDISANGLVVDGVVYVKGWNTRYGRTPTPPHARWRALGDQFDGAAVALLARTEIRRRRPRPQLKDDAAVTASTTDGPRSCSPMRLHGHRLRGRYAPARAQRAGGRR